MRISMMTLLGILLLIAVLAFESEVQITASWKPTVTPRSGSLSPITTQNTDQIGLVAAYTVDDGIYAVDWSLEERLAVSSFDLDSHSQSIWFYDFSNFESPPVLFTEATAKDLKFHPTQSLLASREGSTISLWNIETGTKLREISPSTSAGEFYGMDFSPDGSLIAAVDEGSNVRVWATETGQEVSHLDGTEHGISNVFFTLAHNGLVFHPDGTAIAFCHTLNETVYVWHFKTEEPLITFEGDEYEFSRAIYEMVFSPNGRWVAYSGRGNTVELRDIQTQARKTLQGHAINDGGTTGLAFNPDGTLLAAGAFDGTLEFWDVESGESLLVIEAHAAMVGDLTFNRTGTLLASSTPDGVLHIWGVLPE